MHKPTALAHHFATMEQQVEASRFGMWVFLLTEIMFFGGAFVAYVVYRSSYPDAFSAGSEHMNFWAGTINTIVLLLSSVMMALAVWAAENGRRDRITLYLVLTIVLGVAFLGIKFYEWYEHYQHHLVPGHAFNAHEFKDGLFPQVQLFFSLYFAMTGLHALHMIIGVGILTVLAVMAWRGVIGAHWFSPVEIAGLYWHFVDIVWIFLYPLFYLLHA